MASSVGRFHGFKQFRSLLLRWPEQYLGRQLHTKMNDASPERIHPEKGRIPPMTNVHGLPALAKSDQLA